MHGPSSVAVYSVFLGALLWQYNARQMELVGVTNKTVVVHTFAYQRNAHTVLLFGLEDGYLIRKLDNVIAVTAANDMAPRSPYLPVLELDNSSHIHLALLDVPHAQLLWTIREVADVDVFVYQTSTKIDQKQFKLVPDSCVGSQK